MNNFKKNDRYSFVEFNKKNWDTYLSPSQFKNILNNPTEEYNIRLGAKKRVFSNVVRKKMAMGTHYEDAILELAKKPVANFGFGLNDKEKLEPGERVVTNKNMTAIMNDGYFSGNVDAFIVNAENEITGIIEIKFSETKVDDILTWYKYQLFGYCHIFNVKKAFLVVQGGNSGIFGWKFNYNDFQQEFEEICVPKLKIFYDALINKTLHPDWIDWEIDLNKVDVDNLSFNKDDVVRYNELNIQSKLIKKELDALKEGFKKEMPSNSIVEFDDVKLTRSTFNSLRVNNETRMKDLLQQYNIDLTHFSDEKYKIMVESNRFTVKISSD